MPLSPMSRTSRSPVHRAGLPVRKVGLPVRLAAGAATFALFAGLAGCESKGFINPADNVIDPRKENQLNADGTAEGKTQIILRDLDLGVAAPDEAFANARDVRAGDQEVQSTDYRMGPGDLLRINLNEYPAPGPNIDVLQVSDTGNINLTDVGERNVDGMTVTEAAREIEDAYEDAGLLQPGAARATVLVVEAQNRAYFVMGAVATPQRFLL
ncbi:MAG: polysaccharide biosynthesis/export family protein, partial [Planctomycetota bacterium]